MIHTLENSFKIDYSMVKMGLRHSELILYALLYSFTKTEIGVYYGSQKYLAGRIGRSVRTVQRCLDSLKKRGFIEKVNNGTVKGIRAVIPEKYEKQKSISVRRYDIEVLRARYGDSLDYDPGGYEYPTLKLGVYENVKMTITQYETLRGMVLSEVLDDYIDRLSKLINSRVQVGLPAANNSYKLIKKWIREDFEP